jgi:microcystin-dependent protein
MSQHDYNIANQPGAAVRADINAALETVASLNSGPASPPVTFPNMWWFDESNGLLKQRNPANTQWITIAAVSGSSWVLDAAILRPAVSGDWFGVAGRVPTIDTSGVMEIGGQLDFHPDAAGVEDYRARILRATGANGIWTFTNTGTGGIDFVPGAGGFKLGGKLLQGLPIGTPLFWPTDVPPVGFIMPYGQNLSRTTYADLYTAYGTIYGVGDGSTTFGIFDVRGRVMAGKDDMGGVSANRLTGLSGGIDGDILGAVGGAQSVTLALADIPAHFHNVSASGSSRRGLNGFNVGSAWFGSSGDAADGGTGNVNSASQGGGGAHNNVQPTLIQNVIIWTGVI